jgi:hypothetical protein
MKTAVLNTFFTIAMGLTLAATASAQSGTLAVNVPFSFNVGEVRMDSGRYTIQPMGGIFLMIRSTTNQKAVASIADRAAAPKGRSTGQLLFHQYGGQYYLSEVSWPEGSSRILPRSGVEIQAARNVTASRTIAASSK